MENLPSAQVKTVSNQGSFLLVGFMELGGLVGFGLWGVGEELAKVFAMTVYTHVPPAHIDDFLCAATAVALGGRVIRCRGAQELPGNLVAYQDYVVDMGGRYEPPIWLDHHHDIALSCSCVLLWEVLSWDDRISEADYELMRLLLGAPSTSDVSLVDTKLGWMGIPEKRRPDPMKLSALLEIEGVLNSDQARKILLIYAYAAEGPRQFVEDCYEDPQLGILLQPVYERVLEEDLRARAEVDGMTIYDVGGILVGVSDIPLSRIQYGFERGVDVIIQPNVREPGKSSVTRDSAGRFAQACVLDLFPDLEKHASFVHPAGFMLVVNGTPQEVVQLLQRD
jgi:hypothetical protein